MRRIGVKLTKKIPAWPRILLSSNFVYVLPTKLTLDTLNVMYQYIFQFRQMCVATTQIILTIKHIFLSCQPLYTPQNLSPTQMHDPIYHSHKTVNFLSKAIPRFSI